MVLSTPSQTSAPSNHSPGLPSGLPRFYQCVRGSHQWHSLVTWMLTSCNSEVAPAIDLVLLLARGDLVHAGLFPYVFCRWSLVAPCYSTLPIPATAHIAQIGWRYGFRDGNPRADVGEREGGPVPNQQADEPQGHLAPGQAWKLRSRTTSIDFCWAHESKLAVECPWVPPHAQRDRQEDEQQRQQTSPERPNLVPVSHSGGAALVDKRSEHPGVGLLGPRTVKGTIR